MLDVSALHSAASNLESELGSLANDIDAVTASSCASSCSPNLCASLRTSTLRNSALNVSSLPDLNSTWIVIEAVRSRNQFTELAISTRERLGRISETIDQASGDIKKAVNSSLMEYSDLIHSLSDGVFKTMTEAFPAEEVIEESTDIVETALDYDKYRQYFGVALTSVFIFLVLIYSAGLILGVIYYDETALPTERRAGSNLGGNILLFGVALTFLLGALFMVLTILAFLFGSLLEKGCEPVEDLGYFKEFLDKGKVPGYSLSDITLGIDDLELNTYDVLIGCRADLTPWTVLKMNKVVPLEDYLLYLNYLGNLGQLLANLQLVDISMFRVVTSDLVQSLSDIQTIDPSDVDFDSIKNVLLEQPVSIDISATLTEMRGIRDACNGQAEALWSNFISRMESIEQNEVAQVQSSLNDLQASSSALESSMYSFAESAQEIITSAAYIDAQLQNNMTSILLQSSAGLAGRMLTYLDSYATEVVYVIYNSLGNCRILWNMYKSISIVLCDYGVDTLNGYWFSIGWALFFFTPIIIVAALLANHYKTMDAAVGYQEFDDILEEGDYPDVPAETSFSGAHPTSSVQS
ncbi:prominin-1-a [Plakobranchus ocellatus]|uniref:Prominin-1-a n=1 Tax=Plakobranchus ocellatus TaxID=259542 RepID=A0AAV4ALL3_9GAST|nr:prominin-1-a [Plakobranchus ocellatus]